MRWTHIMIHHSATRDGRTFSWHAIERYHKQIRGWQDIGYHFGIENIGGSYTALVGRPLDMPGAHCIGMNTRAIGFCFVGNYDEKAPDREMIDVAIERVIGPLMLLFGIPSSRIVFHRQYSTKTCPGKKFDYGYLHQAIAEWCQRKAPQLYSGAPGGAI